MMKKTIVCLMLTLIIASMFVTLNVEPVTAGKGGTGDPKVIGVPEDYPTIQGAINEADEGDIIIVSEGVYSEGRINVNKSLTLMADGTVIVDGLRKHYVFYVTAHSVTITGFTVKNSSLEGICLDKVENCKIEGNIVLSIHRGMAGIALHGSECNNIVGNTAATNTSYYGIALWYSDRNNITGNFVTNNTYFGILLEWCDGNNITRNTAINNYHGIRLFNSDDNIVTENTAINNTHFGIRVLGWLPTGSERNNIIGNIVTNNEVGIKVRGSTSNNFIGNIATNNRNHGIVLEDSDSNNVIGNNVSNNRWGIVLGGSDHNTISGNIAIGNPCDGIKLTVSDYNAITGNVVTNNGRGMWLWGDDSNSVIGNDVSDNKWGIALSSCDRNNIATNNATNNLWYGIWLKDCSKNSVDENTVTNSKYGILLDNSEHNIIYHNSFINNTKQAYLINSQPNSWDDAYPSGGNYWNDYSDKYPSVVDEYHGENQDVPGSDGIWDSPYITDADNQDRYPLVKP